MKLKCPSCGKKEMEMMSKSQIAFNSFVNPMVLATVLALVKDWIVPRDILKKATAYFAKETL